MRTKKVWAIVREYAETFVVALALAMFIRTFVVQAFKIPSGSMIPTLSIGDHILVNKFIYGVRIPYLDKVIFPVTIPKRGDVIVFKYPEDESKDFIKRVVGIPGDTIEIKEKMVSINGVKENQPHAIYEEQDGFSMPTRDNMKKMTVPPHSYFVMGDNRDHSLDSRFWGIVDFSKIKGEAFLIYWSWDTDETAVRWRRTFNVIR